MKKDHFMKRNCENYLANTFSGLDAYHGSHRHLVSVLVSLLQKPPRFDNRESSLIWFAAGSNPGGIHDDEARAV